MGIFYRRNRGGKRLQQKSKSERAPGTRLATLLLCLVMVMSFCPTLARAADAGEKLSGIVTFESITLHYAGSDGKPEGDAISDGVLLKHDNNLALRYTYTITEDQCNQITAGTNYYLEVSPHLVLPILDSGSPLTVVETEGEPGRKFGSIYADGNRAWVIFDANSDGNGTVLSEYGELQGAFFFLNCSRAGQPPDSEPPLEGYSNLYGMKFENNEQITFGYAENEPISARAQISKTGGLQDKTITWSIDYTPWQNPSDGDPVGPDTPFELWDTIDTSLHSYIEGSIEIDGQTVAAYTSRDEVQGSEEMYAIAETPAAGGNTTLTFGGTRFNAGEATQGDPATPLKISYQTAINDELLLPGSRGGESITNTADIFAGENGVFNSLNISSSSSVTIPQPNWLTKTGKTTREPGNGSVTEWEVTFSPNGFSFEDSNNLTLHDQLPSGSTLVADSVKVEGTEVTAVAGENNTFTISPIITDNRPVTITYQSRVPEEMYDDGTNLGSNIAWFTFQYGGQDYTTPQAKKDVGSGDGSGTPSTATLVKTNTGYDRANRTIGWTVKINPHQAYLKSGTFTDSLKIGDPCGVAGHTSGLELVGSVNGIHVLVDGSTPTDTNLITLEYNDQQITVHVGETGAKTITLTYTTKICDPCIFANNTSKATFKNTISTNDMVIGSQATTGRSASADSTATVSATVLEKKAPVYDYASGRMKWTVEVDGAGLPMADVVLTDTLPDGLTYVENSLATAPEILSAFANMKDQMLTINLGTVVEKTTVTFDTKVNSEILGFNSDKPVVVQNTIHMRGSADGVEFAEVSHSVQQNFSNHGLVKSSAVNNQQEFIQYEVLINPFGLPLPEKPSLVDTLDKRLQLDTDTLLFYKATLTGTTATNKDQKPGYTKDGPGQPLKVTGFNPDTNSFTTQLPIDANDRGAYVLTYTADILDHQAGGYSNSVRFDGGSVLLGGNKNNSASVGGGGGGGVAARKATITIVKTDSETQAPLSGVSFLLYQWDSASAARGLPFAKGETDAQGKLSFRVKPEASYELVETQSLPGYGSAFGWESLPGGVTKIEDGLLVTAGAAKSEFKLTLTNEAHTTDIVFRLVNEFGIPIAGEKVKIFTSNPTGNPDASPAKEATVAVDGTVRFPGLRRGKKYYVQIPGGGIMTIEVPADDTKKPSVILPDGTTEILTENYKAEGVTPPNQQWEITVRKVISGGTTPLAGAAIGLFADEGCQTLIKTGVSGPDGVVMFLGLIKGQNYWVKETAAPSGYELNTSAYGANETNSNVTIENIAKEAPPVNPGGPSDPDNPGNSSNPDDPGDSSSPSSPGDLSDPSTPSVSENSSNEGVSTNNPNIPQTGDYTGLLIVVTLLSGILLAAMTAYRLWRQKKRGEK